MDAIYSTEIRGPGRWHANHHATHMQLEAGVFKSDVCAVDLQDVLLIHEKTNLPFFSADIFPGYVLFLFPLNVEGPYLVNEGLYNDSKQIVLMGDSKNCALVPHNFEQLVVAIRIDALSSYVEQEESELLLNVANSRHQIKVESEYKLTASKFMQEIQKRIIRKQEDVVNSEFKASAYNKLIISFLVEYMHYYQEQDSSSGYSSSHERIIHRGLHFLSSEHHLPITLDRLSSELFMSKRSIQYAFSEIVGKTPREFLKIVKMNKIRNDFLDAVESSNVMPDILHKYGITNPARFKHEYFDFFGEHPKDTIAAGLRLVSNSRIGAPSLDSSH